MGAININTNALVELTNKLEKLHKSAMPVAIRSTLNDAAFDMKQKTGPQEFDANFTIRKKNFFKSHTAVNKSPNTFKLKQMKAEFGIIKGKSEAGDNLEKQEFGGVIKNRSYIPLKEARTGKNPKKVLSRRFYLKNIKPRGRNIYKNQELIKAAFSAGKGGFLIYNEILFQVKTISKAKGGKLNLKLNPLYSYKEGRAVTIKKAPFMKPAADKTMRKIPDLYFENAKRRFARHGIQL
jgi:hypothetical protein